LLAVEQLPYIDEHSTTIDATRERVWEALVSSLRVSLGTSAPGPLRMALNLTPAEMRGDWRGALHVDDALPGFSITEVSPPERLELSGGHRFSSYKLAFEIDAVDDERSTLRALTWAAFPGLTGRAYRALVIGSGAHKLVVCRLLRNIARRV
jgi:uncharacterized protein YndB with AHSA1/START domain